MKRTFILFGLFALLLPSCRNSLDLSQEELDKELAVAVEQCDYGKAKLLLTAGANPNTDQLLLTDGMIIHAIVTQKGKKGERTRIAKLLIDNGAEYSTRTLTTLIHLCNLEVAKYLIENGVDINGTGGNGWPPLIWAIGDTQFDTAEYLIDSGADVNTVVEGLGLRDDQPDQKWTPLDLALYFKNKYTPDYPALNNLIKKIKDRGGRTYAGLRKQRQENLLNHHAPSD